MNTFDVNIIALCVLAAAVVILSLLVLKLFFVIKKLKADYLRLAEIVHRNSQDVASLCAAGLAVDEHVQSSEQHIGAVIAKLNELTEFVELLQQAQPSHAYSGDIQKVRSGASIPELMQSSGISHDEAALLIRLHGPKTAI